MRHVEIWANCAATVVNASVIQLWHLAPAIVLNVVPETSIVSFLVAELHHSPLIVFHAPRINCGTTCNKDGLLVELCCG